MHWQWRETQRATTARSRAINPQAAIKYAIKRKVGYEVIDDKMSQARQQMINMNMNDQ